MTVTLQHPASTGALTTAPVSNPHAGSSATPTTPALRIAAAPRSEPEFDSRPDLPDSTSRIPAQRSLTLELFGTDRPEPLPGTRSAGMPARVPAGRLTAVRPDDWGPRASGRAELPDPGQWAARLVQAVMEVHAGQRSSAQLTRWMREDLFMALKRRGAVALRSADPRLRTLVRSIRLCEPEDGIVEASAFVTRGGRGMAVALRLEGLDGRWLCTALDVLEPGGTYATGLEEPLTTAA